MWDRACSQSRPGSAPLSRPCGAPARLQLGFLLRGEAVFGAQPSEEGLVVVAGLEQALRLGAPVQALRAVELGRHDELLQRADGGGGGDHGLQFVSVELAARQRHVRAELEAEWAASAVLGVELDALFVPGCVPLFSAVLGAVLRFADQAVQPFHDALRLARPDRRDAGVPAPAHAVDALDQLRQCEEPGGLQAGRQGRVQPSRHRVARLRRLGHQAFEPAQRVELARDQAGPPARALCGRAVGLLKGGHLLGLREVLQAVRLRKRFQAGQGD